MRFDINEKLLTEPIPCTGCTYYKECADEKKACNRFLLYVAECRWINKPQSIPHHGIYRMLFDNEHQKKLKSYMNILRRRYRKADFLKSVENNEVKNEI